MTTENAIPVEIKVDLQERPGNLIRRVHQLHNALWAAEVSRDITSTQFAVLTAVQQNPNCDQATVSRIASLDPSTAGSVTYRLSQAGFVRIAADPIDRRRNLVSLSEDGERLFGEIAVAAAKMTDRLVSPLSDVEGAELVRLLKVILTER